MALARQQRRRRQQQQQQQQLRRHHRLHHQVYCIISYEAFNLWPLSLVEYFLKAAHRFDFTYNT